MGVTLAGWAAFRAMTLGLLPGAELFTVSARPAEAATPSTTYFPPLDPPVPFQEASYSLPPPQPLQAQYRPVAMPVYYPMPQPAYYSPPVRVQQASQPLYYGPVPQLDEWPLSRFASAPISRPATASFPAQPIAPTFTQPPGIDRVQLTAWALVRGRQGVTIAPGSLAPGGTLGGSQAGARITYLFSRQLAASLRSTSPVGGGSGGEVAAGIRYTPFKSIPIAFTAERRKAIGRYGGGRDAFAVFMEGGVYQRPVWGMQLDGYGQAGIVGARSRDWFADGGFTLTRPLFREFSGGFGVWGGTQPGLYRIDAGPRVSMRLRKNVRVHFDWRQRVAGNALPRSGPAVTLAGDF